MYSIAKSVAICDYYKSMTISVTICD